MEIVKQQKAAAQYLGVTATALRQWEKEPGFPDCSGGYNIQEIRKWVGRKQRKGSEQSERSEQLTEALKAEKLRQEMAKTKLLEMEIQKRDGLLQPRKGNERSASVVLASIVDLCDQFPDILAAICTPDQAERVREFAKEQLDSWRSQLASQLRSVSPDSQP